MPVKPDCKVDEAGADAAAKLKGSKVPPPGFEALNGTAKAAATGRPKKVHRDLHAILLQCVLHLNFWPVVQKTTGFMVGRWHMLPGEGLDNPYFLSAVP